MHGEVWQGEGGELQGAAGEAVQVCEQEAVQGGTGASRIWKVKKLFSILVFFRNVGGNLTMFAKQQMKIFVILVGVYSYT